jgi:hypothetical protein
VRVRVLGAEDMLPDATSRGSDTVIAGEPGSGRALDQVAVTFGALAISYEVLVDGIWQETRRDGYAAGVDDRPFSGLRMRAAKGSIRYRLSFVGSGFSEWAEDGAPIQKAGARVDAVEVEHRMAARAGTTLTYRARFRGEDWTAWTESGVPLESKDGKAELVALEVRSSTGVRYEVALVGRGWQNTRADGLTAGDAKGVRSVDGVRVFGGDGPVRYRTRSPQGWDPWMEDGATAGRPGLRYAMTGIQIQLVR